MRNSRFLVLWHGALKTLIVDREWFTFFVGKIKYIG